MDIKETLRDSTKLLIFFQEVLLKAEHFMAGWRKGKNPNKILSLDIRMRRKKMKKKEFGLEVAKLR